MKLFDGHRRTGGIRKAERMHERYNPRYTRNLPIGIRAMQVAAADCVPSGSRPILCADGCGERL